MHAWPEVQASAFRKLPVEPLGTGADWMDQPAAAALGAANAAVSNGSASREMRRRIGIPRNSVRLAARSLALLLLDIPDPFASTLRGARNLRHSSEVRPREPPQCFGSSSLITGCRFELGDRISTPKMSASSMDPDVRIAPGTPRRTR